MGRTFLIGALAFVVGAALGAWQPRGEPLGLRAESDRLAREARSCQRGAASAGITQLLGGGRQGLRDAAAPGADAEGTGRPAPKADGPPAPAAPAPARVRDDGEAVGEAGGEAAADATPEAMRDALDARAAQARAALLEQADPTDEELAALDAAVDKMNTRLKAQVDAFVASVEAGGEPDRRELMEFAAEALDAVIEADDAFVGALPADVRESVDAEVVDPFSYIDGETLESLARLEGFGE